MTRRPHNTVEHLNMPVFSHSLSWQSPTRGKTICAFCGQFSFKAQMFFPISYPSSQHSGWLLLSKCYPRHSTGWRMGFPAIPVSICSFPWKANDYIFIFPMAGWVSFVAMAWKIGAVASAESVAWTLIKMSSAPGRNKTWKDTEASGTVWNESWTNCRW